MKFLLPMKCPSCGHSFLWPAYAERKISQPTCPNCGTQGYFIESLTVSTGAERLLYRSQNELDGGDFSISIICSAIAVESYLTAAFLKWKGIDSFGVAGKFPTDAESAEDSER